MYAQEYAPLSKPGHNGMRSWEQHSEYALLLARLETPPVIEQAKGTLMAQSASGEDEAFDFGRTAADQGQWDCQLGKQFGSGVSPSLTCGSGCPWMTVRDRSSPRPIARVPRLDRMAVADTRIVLRTGGAGDPIVDHPGQPADYVHADGTVWTWLGRWRLVGGVRKGDRIVDRDQLRMYDLVMSSGGDT